MVEEQSRLMVGAKAFVRSLLPIALALLAAYHKGLLPVTSESMPHQAATWIDLLEIVLTGSIPKGAVGGMFAKTVLVRGA